MPQKTLRFPSLALSRSGIRDSLTRMLEEALIKLLRDQILNLRCSLYSRTGALLNPNFGRSLHLIRASSTTQDP
jgi:hypothetical protein